MNAACTPSLFEHLLGEDFARLPAEVQVLHRVDLPARFVGQVVVEPARGLVARWLARLLGLPTTEVEAAVKVDIHADTLRADMAGERWTRHFPPRPMRSRLWAQGGLLRERLGPATLSFRLHGDANGIRWQLAAVHVLGLRVPRRWLGEVGACESADDGRYRFEVSASLPLIGHLVAYRGTLAPQPAADVDLAGPIVVFDGVCHLCNGWVSFLLRFDRRQQYRFAAMQTERGRALLAAHGLDADDPSSFLLLREGMAITDSDAIIAVLSDLGGVWRIAQALRLVPRLLRDPLYRFVARHRYRVFGRRQSCSLPPPGARQRFLH